MEKKDSQQDWLQDLDQRVQKAYAELLETAYVRSESHKQANITLEQAIQITHEVTLKFLRDTFKEESARVIPNNKRVRSRIRRKL